MPLTEASVKVGGQEIRVLRDGSWQIGETVVSHGATLLYLKAHLVWDGALATVVDGPQRAVVILEGPPLQVLSFEVDRKKQEVRLTLDDGSSETLRRGEISMDPATGRFEVLCRGLRAAFSRAAHQGLIENVLEEAGSFYIDLGGPKIPILT